MITTKQIKFAIAVAKHKNFNKAANDCSISPAALSAAISEMEKQLDVQVFERDCKHVIITKDGEEVIQRLQKIFLELTDLENFTKASKKSLFCKMSMGIIPTIAPYLLPKVLPLIRDNFPDFSLTIFEQASAQLVKRLKNGEIDVAVMALPYPTAGLITFPFWEENLYAVFCDDDKHANLAQIELTALNKLNLMLLGEEHCLSEHIMSICKWQTASQRRLEGASLTTLIQMSLAKMGTTLVPEMAIEQFRSQNEHIAFVPLALQGPHRSIAFAVRANYTRLKDIELLREYFILALKDVAK